MFICLTNNNNNLKTKESSPPILSDKLSSFLLAKNITYLGIDLPDRDVSRHTDGKLISNSELKNFPPHLQSEVTLIRKALQKDVSEDPPAPAKVEKPEKVKDLPKCVVELDDDYYPLSVFWVNSTVVDITDPLLVWNVIPEISYFNFDGMIIHKSGVELSPSNFIRHYLSRFIAMGEKLPLDVFSDQYFVKRLLSGRCITDSLFRALTCSPNHLALPEDEEKKKALDTAQRRLATRVALSEKWSQYDWSCYPNDPDLLEKEYKDRLNAAGTVSVRKHVVQRWYKNAQSSIRQKAQFFNE